MTQRLLAYKPLGKLYRDYSSTNLTTNSWTDLSASLPRACTAIEIFDSSGKTIKLAVGAAGSEVEELFYIVPGGNIGILPVNWKKGDRISLQGLATAATGVIVVNMFG